MYSPKADNMSCILYAFIPPQHPAQTPPPPQLPRKSQSLPKSPPRHITTLITQHVYPPPPPPTLTHISQSRLDHHILRIPHDPGCRLAPLASLPFEPAVPQEADPARVAFGGLIQVGDDGYPVPQSTGAAQKRSRGGVRAVTPARRGRGEVTGGGGGSRFM